MQKDLVVQEGITIPGHEIELVASRAGGPGGQHVNKANTRITLLWNVQTTTALTDEQRARLLLKLHNRLTIQGVLIIHSAISRSQEHNKQDALRRLAALVRSALYIPKKRMKIRIPRAVHEQRLAHKARRSTVKKMRRVRSDDD